MQSACAVLYCHLWPVWLYQIFFFTFLPKRYDFWGKRKVTVHTMCVLIFSTTVSETYLIIRITERYDKKMYIILHVKCPLLCQILKKLEFSRQILEKILQYQLS